MKLNRQRVPVLMQMSASECGAACLAMILSHHGRETAVASLREQLDGGRDGLTARAIGEAARSYGLRVRAFSMDDTGMRDLSLPAIVHWEFNHFVVVERWSPDGVDVVDPAVGRRRLAPDEFRRGFTGIALTFESGALVKRVQSPLATPCRDYLKAILHMPGIAGVIFQILGASLILQVLGLTVPVATKILLDAVLPSAETNIMTVLGIGMAVAVIALATAGYLRGVLLIYLEAHLDTRMMLGFFQHVLTLPFPFFQQRTTGDLLMRLGSNTVIRETLSTQTVSIALDGSLVLVYLTLLLVVKPSLGLIVAGLGLVQFVLLLATQRRVRSLTRRDLSASAASQSYLVEAISGIATLKACGVEDRALAHWSNLFFKHLNVSVERNQLASILNTALMTLRTLAPLLLLWVGASYVLDGRMSVGTMLALNALSMSVLTPIASVVSSAQQIQLVGAHLDRMSDVLKTEPEQVKQRACNAPALAGRIDVREVTFRYARNAPPALRDVTVTAEPGQKIAIVGRTGSGKSSLAKLLLGLYPCTKGEILYDGMQLSSLNYQSVRRQIGTVLQESSLFTGSIRHNIAFHDPSLPLEQVVEAARLAAIHDEIMAMPMGYDTLLCEGGSSLSGGQRQRILLARAVAHRPAILLLDEATSHLDPITESAIDGRLADLSCTRIVIAHRLSTVRNADLILVLDQGTIVESGSHADLLSRGGRYAALHLGQTIA